MFTLFGRIKSVNNLDLDHKGENDPAHGSSRHPIMLQPIFLVVAMHANTYPLLILQILHLDIAYIGARAKLLVYSRYHMVDISNSNYLNPLYFARSCSFWKTGLLSRKIGLWSLYVCIRTTQYVALKSNDVQNCTRFIAVVFHDEPTHSTVHRSMYATFTASRQMSSYK